MNMHLNYLAIYFSLIFATIKNITFTFSNSLKIVTFYIVLKVLRNQLWIPSISLNKIQETRGCRKTILMTEQW